MNSLRRAFVSVVMWFSVKKNPTSPAALKAKEEVIAFLTENHITTDTNALLNEFIKEVQSENPDETKVGTLRTYLVMGVTSADIASVEYSLIDNASNAIAAMTREKLQEFTVSTADGRTLPLDSDEGLGFLIDKLANPANNSTALQVFFAQTGLSERAVDIIANTLNLDAIPAAIQELEGQLVGAFTNLKGLDGAFGAFASDNSVSYSSYKDAVKHYIKTLDKEYKDKSPAEKQMYKLYKKFLLKTLNADFAKGLAPQDILPTLAQVHMMAVQAISKNVVEGAQQLNYLAQVLESRISAMEALKLPKNSEKEGTRAEFLAKAKAAYQILEESIASINGALQ